MKATAIGLLLVGLLLLCAGAVVVASLDWGLAFLLLWAHAVYQRVTPEQQINARPHVELPRRGVLMFRKPKRSIRWTIEAP